MSRLTTVRRLSFCGAAIAIVFVSLIPYIIHTRPVQHYALRQLQTYLQDKQSLALQAEDFEYKPFSSAVEFRNVAVRGVAAMDMPAAITAQRVSLSIPVWRLVTGSFEGASIRIDGLGVHWVTDANGRSNWPAMSGSSDGSIFRGPAISVTGGEITVEDSRNGFSLRLSHGELATFWNYTRNQYSITFAASGGRVGWKDNSFALDKVQLKSALTASGFYVDSLQLNSEQSRAEISGLIAEPPAQIGLRGTFEINMHQFSRALGLKTPAQGRVQGVFFASGPAAGVQVRARLFGNRIVSGETAINRATAEALFNTATGELQVLAVTGNVFSGQLTGKARIWTGDRPGRSEFVGRLAALDPDQVARALGARLPLRRGASIEISGSWPGLNWRRATITGVARSSSATVNFSAAGDGDSIRASLAGQLGDSAAMRGDLAFKLSDNALTGNVTGSVASLARLTAELERVMGPEFRAVGQPASDGSAHWSATLHGSLAHPFGSVQAAINGLSIGSWKGADVEVDADYDSDRTEIRLARLKWGGQTIQVKGRIGGSSADAPLQLDGTIEGRSLGPLFGNLEIAQVAEAAVSGTIRVSGSVGRPAVESTFNVPALTAFGHRFSRTTLDATWHDGELTVSRFRAEQNPDSDTPGRLDASGSLDVARGRYSYRIAGHNLRPNAALPSSGGLAMDGVFHLESQGTGTLDNPTLSATVTGRDVKVAGIAVGELHGEAEAREHWATARLTAPALNARAASTFAMDGRWPFDFTLDAENTHLNSTPATSFDVKMRGAGSVAERRLERMTASVRNLRLATLGQEIAGDGPIELSYADGRLRVESLALKSGESSLNLSGTIPLEKHREPGVLTVEGHVVLDPFLRSLPGMDASKTGGIAEVTATLTGNAQHWMPAGSIKIQDGRFRSQSIPLDVTNLSGRLDVDNGMIRTDQLRGNAGTGTLRISGSAPLPFLSEVLPGPAHDARRPARFSVQLDDLRLSSGKGASRATVTIGLNMAAEMSALSADALKATAHFSELRVEAGTKHIRQTAPTRITVAGGVARLENFDANGSGAALRASGSIGLTGEYPLDVDVVGETDLAIFAGLLAPIEAAGPLRLQARVGGTLNDPRTSGFVSIEQATVISPEPRLEAAGVRLNAILGGDQLELREFSGTLNGGPFKGGGSLKVRSGRIVESSLYLSAKDNFLEYPAGVKTTSSHNLKLVTREGRPIIEGLIELQDGYYDSPLELFGSSQGLNATAMKQPEPTGTAVGLDLQIVTKRPVEMDNNLGRLAATANLHVAGDVSRPRLIGALELEQDGKLYFGDRTYYIERGTIRFLDAPKPTPELNIHAYTRARDYTVKLGLTGELNEVTTTFTSDPPLSRDDVIAVLLTGKTVAENRGVDLRSLEAFALATGAMNASLSSRLHRTIGVSRVSIQPAAVAAESNSGSRITITQDFTRTLRLMYSMNLSDSNDQIWVTEYDLSRRFITRAVKQSDNTYRGEFRHDIRFGSSSVNRRPVAPVPTPVISRVDFIGGGSISPSELAKRFKIKAGQKANPMKLRKSSEKLAKFLMKREYLESRLHVDRADDEQNLRLTVRIELGPRVELAYGGASLPRKQKARLREVWHAGISNQQRPRVAKDAILDYFAENGYLRGQVSSEVLSKGDHKLVRFDLRPGTRYRDVKIKVEGVGGDRVRDVMALLDQRHLRLSIYRDGRRATEATRRFYEQRGYLTANIATPVPRLDAERRTGRFVIPVVEGPLFRVGAVKFSGNTAITGENLRAGLPLEPGIVFEPARLEPASAALKLKYGKLGYGDADIEYEIERHDDRASADISFTIIENKQTSIGSVKVEGNRHTSADFARSQLRVAEGEVANTALIRESARNLAQTGAFASTDMQLQPPAESGATDKRVQVADLVVAVSEPKPFRLLYGGLYDSGGGPGFIVDLQNQNSLGAGRTLGLRTRVDPETDEVRLYVTRPFWRRHRLSTTIGTYFTREIENYQTTPTHKLGASIQQDLPLRSRWLVSYGYRFEKQRGFIQDPSAPDIQADVVTVAPLTLTTSRDTRDSFLDATRGSFLSHGFELAPGFLGSDYPYARYYLQYFKYFPLTRPRPVPFGEQPQRSRLVFASGSRVGVQKGFTAQGAVLTDRFYAGGGTTVRGFKQDELGPKLSNGEPSGGNAVLVLNQELRYPLFWIFDAVTFVDVGNVFPRASDFKLSELRTAGGFGLRIRNPFVVLRFDYGFKFNRRPGETRGAFFFSIGQAF